MKRLLAALLAMSFCVPAFAQAQTETRLLLSADSVRSGQTVWAGVEMKMQPRWHTYWRNGGDAGIPTTIQWTLPDGIKAGEINWPAPEKAVVGTTDFMLTTYGYEDEVVLLVPLKLADNLPPGPMKLEAEVKWQECSDICVMGQSEVSATLTIGNENKPSAEAGEIEQWQKKIPKRDSNAKVTATWETPQAQGTDRAVIFEATGMTTNADFFPYESKHFDVQGATDSLNESAGKIRFRKVVKKSEGDWPERLNGLIVSKDGSRTVNAVEVSLHVVLPIEERTSLLLMLGFAFIGGLILNVMPCVLPVIALKVLGFVNQAKEAPERVRKLGLVYGIGVLVSFVILAMLAIGVQRAGGLANWGDAFRHPQFRVLMTILMTLISLNLFGLFEITLGSGATGAAMNLASKQGYSGAFFNGVLATMLATPCTAPFLGAALAFAFTQPAIVTVMVFLAAGTGLAFPFVLVCLQPSLLKALPKPGAWMEKFKIGMGFPMLATVVWLIWSFSHNEDFVLWMGLFLVVLAFAAWIWGEFFQRGTKHRGVAVLVCLILLISDYTYILEGQLQWRAPAHGSKTGIEWKIWSLEAVDQARRDGHPVLVDFTAKSCLNCIVNKATSIEVDQTRAKLKEIGAVVFEADYTEADPDIARELRRFNRSGVPLVLVYPKDLNKDPIVLPTILTPGIVIDALNQAAK